VLESLLGEIHPESDFAITIPLELLEQTKHIFNLLLGSTTGISLLVSARQSDIVSQFLVETAMLSLIGGLMGVVFGLCTPPGCRAAQSS